LIPYEQPLRIDVVIDAGGAVQRSRELYIRSISTRNANLNVIAVHFIRVTSMQWSGYCNAGDLWGKVINNKKMRCILRAIARKLQISHDLFSYVRLKPTFNITDSGDFSLYFLA